ncbi:mycothione reductase [Actinomycetaceae bacterium L2_0104]
MTELTSDLAIIGSGSGNTLVSSFWEGKRVVIAEKNPRFGGTCLNFGCIPTKMFVRTSMVARSPEEAERLDVRQHTDSVDWRAIRDRIFGRTDAASASGKKYRERADNVTLISETVRLTGLKSFKAANGTRVEADHLVLAAGSRPVLPDVPGIDLPRVHTSDTVMRIGELPRKIVILGGGYVACEFAGIFSGLGSEVVQINRGPRLMKKLDAEIQEAFQTEAGKHWEVRTGRTLEAITAKGSQQLTVEVAVSEDGSREFHDADIVLVAQGRRPNSDLIGAAEVGIDLHEDGRVVVDEYLRVLAGGQAVPGLYALGDICSPKQLKHVANHQARVVAHNLENPANLREEGDMPIPAAVFSHPELAEVGLTEAEARETIGSENVTVKTQRYGDTAYGWAMEDTTGIFKVVADRRDGSVLGAHAMGYQASILIQPIVMAMSFGIPALQAARGQYWPHPALMEVVENALLGVESPSED